MTQATMTDRFRSATAPGSSAAILKTYRPRAARGCGPARSWQRLDGRVGIRVIFPGQRRADFVAGPSGGESRTKLPEESLQASRDREEKGLRARLDIVSMTRAAGNQHDRSLRCLDRVRPEDEPEGARHDKEDFVVLLVNMRRRDCRPYVLDHLARSAGFGG